MQRNLRWLTAPALALALVAATSPAGAQQELRGLDAYVEKAMTDWGVAGLSLAIVRDGEVIYARGFGVRDASTREPVDEHTLFAIGSNSKLFTAVAAGILVDEDKMDWDARITEYLPWFQLHDPYVTREFRLRDALSHRSGLGRRGDALWYGTDYGREEIIRRVRHLEPNSSFRSEYGYQNIMFLTAGEAIAAAAGMSWDDFVDRRIFAPLDMDRSNTSVKPLARMQNVAQPHSATPDGPRPIPWRDIDNVAPAGSINSSAAEMANWIEMLLDWGEYEGARIIEERTLREIMSPHSIGGDPSRDTASVVNFSNYGLGVGLIDYNGYKVQTHTGGIDGMLSNVTTVPEADVGWVILTNTSFNGVYSALSSYLLASFLGGERKDFSALALQEWTKQQEQAEKRRKEIDDGRVAGTRPSLSLEKYVGTYNDPMYGDLRVTGGAAGLRVDWGTFDDLPLEHWHFNTFVGDTSGGIGAARTFFTFQLNARGEVDEVDVQGLEDFDRVPEKGATAAN